jgi:DNA anti-recombination protein RmuC
MKKSHKKPARGSYKEAKAIQNKKMKSFFDYNEEDQKDILSFAIEEGTKLQQETMDKYEHSMNTMFKCKKHHCYETYNGDSEWYCLKCRSK